MSIFGQCNLRSHLKLCVCVCGGGYRIYSFIRGEVASAFSLSKPEPALYSKRFARLCEYREETQPLPCWKTLQSREELCFHTVVKGCLYG